MPTPTYLPIANITLGSTATSVTFSSISQVYRDLVLVMTIKDTGSTGNTAIGFNSDSANNYSLVSAEGNGTSTTSGSSSARGNITTGWNYSTVNTATFNVVTVNVMDYSATDKHKSVLVRGNNAALGTTMVAGRWASTAAVTTINLQPINGFAAGCTFALYGIVG